MAASLETGHVLIVIRIAERAFELDQQCLEADAELQRGLAIAAAVEVGAGAEEQGLAGVELLAAAEHGGEPLLGPQLFVALPASGDRAEAGVDPVGGG